MKQAFAANQKIGKLGSELPFAAAIPKVYYADKTDETFPCFNIRILFKRMQAS